MTPSWLYDFAITPAMRLLPEMDSPAARFMLLCIAGQESGMQFRKQSGNGPARGFWQCEISSVTGIWNGSYKKRLLDVIQALDFDLLAPRPYELHQALSYNDILAATVARLILRMDSNPLPKPVSGGEEEAWQCYIRNWRPGKPRRETWNGWYAQARKFVVD